MKKDKKKLALSHVEKNEDSQHRDGEWEAAMDAEGRRKDDRRRRRRRRRRREKKKNNINITLLSLNSRHISEKFSRENTLHAQRQTGYDDRVFCSSVRSSNDVFDYTSERG
jgi:hypothetical protein